MRATRVLMGILLLLPAAFCGFGFLASFEDGPHMMLWHIGYAGLGITFLAGSTSLIFKHVSFGSQKSR